MHDSMMQIVKQRFPFKKFKKCLNSKQDFDFSLISEILLKKIKVNFKNKTAFIGKNTLKYE